MGLFNVAYHFFAPVFSLATAGFPIAVSRLVSESSSRGRWNDARQVKRVAMPLFLAIGAGGMVLMLLLAPLYCRWVSGAAYALAPMLALAPAVPLACLTSVYRGYYEGLGNMVPTAFSQVLEAAIKLGLGPGGCGGGNGPLPEGVRLPGNSAGVDAFGRGPGPVSLPVHGRGRRGAGSDGRLLGLPGVSGPALPFSRGRYRAAALSKFPSPSGAPGNPPPALGGHACPSL